MSPRPSSDQARSIVEPGALFLGIPPGRPIWVPFSSSICAHIAVLSIAVSYLHFLATRPDPVPEVKHARVLQLSAKALEEFRPSPRPAAAKPSPPAPGSGHPGRSGNPSGRPSRRLDAPPEAPQASYALLPERQFRIPPPLPARKALQTLLQLDLPPTMDVRQELRVPRLVILAEANQHKIAAPFIAPPERKRTTNVPRDVILDVRTPVLEVRPGYAKTPEFLARVNPRLTPPVGATAPAAGATESKPAKLASTIAAENPASPVNIISLPDRPIPVSAAIVLPPLNQASEQIGGSGAPIASADHEFAGLGRQHGKPGKPGSSGTGDSPGHSNLQGDNGGTGSPGASSGAGGSFASGSGAGTGSGSGAGSVPGTGSGTGAGAGNGAGSANGNGTSLNATGSGNGGNGTGAAAGGGGSGNGLGSAPATEVAKVVRSRTGEYEVAVVQSSGVVPGSVGLLKGRPVYSVYVAVGARKEWILQYCLRGTDAKAAPAQVVQLGALTPVSAPFAFTILRPSMRFRNSDARYGFIHGYVNAAGRFEQLAEVGEPVIENLTPVLHALEQWEFRPASKDGQPAVVEILLCIPNLSS